MRPTAQLKTGRDVAIAALLGAEEFGFATAPLVTLGCIMMRVCHLNTCPVGVATQNPELRKKFTGDPEHVVNFMYFMAPRSRARSWPSWASARSTRWSAASTSWSRGEAIDHWKAKGLDLSHDPVPRRRCRPDGAAATARSPQDHGLEKRWTIPTCSSCASRRWKRASGCGTCPSAISTAWSAPSWAARSPNATAREGLPDDTIQLHFQGSAGQSFGAFVPTGITLELEGDANDYVGKGLSGGKIIVYPPTGSTFVPEENIIIGNVAFYGATGGEAYFRGMAGERFCVRNSGVNAVVEGVGDHGCEYMTGGRVVMLGPTGRNFAAGMSGGIAYVLDEARRFRSALQPAKWSTWKRLRDAEEIERSQGHDRAPRRIHRQSTVARRILADWDDDASPVRQGHAARLQADAGCA